MGGNKGAGDSPWGPIHEHRGSSDALEFLRVGADSLNQVCSSVAIAVLQKFMHLVYQRPCTKNDSRGQALVQAPLLPFLSTVVVL